MVPLRSLIAALRVLVLVHLRHERMRTLLTLAGVALGVAVVVAISLANQATLAAFRGTVETMSGRTELEIVPQAGLLDEALLADAIAMTGVAHAVPRVTAQAGFAQAKGEVLTILGVDIVNDAYVRSYAVGDRAGPTDDEAHLGAAPRDSDDLGENASASTDSLLESVFDPRSILITRTFAQRHGLKPGDILEMATGLGTASMRVAGLLDDQGPARIVGGNIAVMDIGAAQDRFKLRGKLSGIDIMLEPGAELATVAEALRRVLPDNVTVQRPAQRGESVEKMLAAFRYNLTALAAIALVVGVFLIYNTVSVSVLRRREEIGTLRALGAQRRGILAVFLGEGLLLGVVGSVAGVIGGTYLAQGLLMAMNQAVAAHWFKTTAEAAAFDPVVGMVAGGLGVGLSLLAALVPALEAASVPPANTMRAGTREVERARFTLPLALAGAVVLLLAWLAARQPAVGGLPLFGFASAFLLILGSAMQAPLFLGFYCRAVARPYGALFGAEGQLAVTAVAGSRARTIVAVTGLMIGLAMVVGLAIMVGSFRRTVIEWLGQTLQADLFIQPVALGAAQGEPMLLPIELADEIAAIPGVGSAEPFRILRIDFQGSQTNLGAGNFALQSRRDHLPMLDESGATVLERAMAPTSVIVTETFANRYAVKVGDTIELPVSAGLRPFRVEGIYTDYSSDLGYVVMHRATFERHFPGDARSNSFTVYLEDGANAGAVRQAILDRVAFPQSITIDTSGELRAKAIDIFDRTFAVTRVLMVIAMTISILGITTTLLAMIIDRRRELATLRFLGMSRWAVGRVTMYESSLLCGAGTILGLACGGALSVLLVYVINRQSFGWTIQFHVPWGELALATGLLFAFSLLSGLLPAREAGRVLRRT